MGLGQVSRILSIELEDVPCSVEINDGSVDDHLVLTGIWRNVVEIFHRVTVGSKLMDDKVDVYHHGWFEDASPGRGCPGSRAAPELWAAADGLLDI